MNTVRRDPDEGFFNEDRLFKAFMILIILFSIRLIFGLCIGLVSEVNKSNGYDELIALADELNPFLTNSLVNYHAPTWLQDVSLLEIFQFGCLTYAVFIAFGFDLCHSAFPLMLPIVLCVEFVFMHAVHFSEILGANLIWLIVFGIAVAALGIAGVGYLLGSPVLMATYFFTGAGAVISSIITGVLLPIVSAGILIGSIVDFFF